MDTVILKSISEIESTEDIYKKSYNFGKIIEDLYLSKIKDLSKNERTDRFYLVLEEYSYLIPYFIGFNEQLVDQLNNLSKDNFNDIFSDAIIRMLNKCKDDDVTKIYELGEMIYKLEKLSFVKDDDHLLFEKYTLILDKLPDLLSIFEDRYMEILRRRLDKIDNL